MTRSVLAKVRLALALAIVAFGGAACSGGDADSREEVNATEVLDAGNGSIANSLNAVEPPIVSNRGTVPDSRGAEDR